MAREREVPRRVHQRPGGEEPSAESKKLCPDRLASGLQVCCALRGADQADVVSSDQISYRPDECSSQSSAKDHASYYYEGPMGAPHCVKTRHHGKTVRVRGACAIPVRQSAAPPHASAGPVADDLIQLRPWDPERGLGAADMPR